MDGSGGLRPIAWRRLWELNPRCPEQYFWCLWDHLLGKAFPVGLEPESLKR